MQEDFEYDALTIRAPQRTRTRTRTRWYTRLWPACLGHGCSGRKRKRQRFALCLIGYDPVGQLHRAASVGDVALVEALINGSEYHVNESDRRGRTALHYASAHNHPNVVGLLVSNKCTDINIRDDEGCTPLIKATQRDNVECVSILVLNGADPHIVDFGGDAALHHAVVRGNKRTVEILLNFKADINAKSEYGFTPYQLALYERQHDIAEFLINNGAEAHSVLKPNRLSENPAVPESRTKDKGSTSAIKDDNENSSSSHTVEGTEREGFLCANSDDGIVPQPTNNTELPSSPGPLVPPGPHLLLFIWAINGPGGLPGPHHIRTPKPPRSNLWAPQKSPLSPTLPRWIISPGPPWSISLPLPRCMPPEQPQQVKT